MKPIPTALVDVALIDAPTAATAGGMSRSQWLAEVREGRAPAPVIREARMTRWRLVDVRRYLIDRAERGSAQEATARLLQSATAAAAAARAKRGSTRED